MDLHPQIGIRTGHFDASLGGEAIVKPFLVWGKFEATLEIILGLNPL